MLFESFSYTIKKEILVAIHLILKLMNPSHKLYGWLKYARKINLYELNCNFSIAKFFLSFLARLNEKIDGDSVMTADWLILSRLVNKTVGVGATHN
jgi:hypothetical protein